MGTKYYEIKITWCNDLKTVIVIEEGWVTEIVTRIISLEIVKIEVKENWGKKESIEGDDKKWIN